jgi:hypothetical protein
MGGNVFQWTDSPYDPPDTLLRGTSFGAGADATFFQNSLSYFDPTRGTLDVGFRIAMVPEPGTLTLAAVLAGLGLFAARRRMASCR